MGGNGQPLPVQEQQLPEQFPNPPFLFLAAAEDDLIAPGHDGGVKAGADQAQVLVVASQDPDHLLLVVNFNHLFPG